MGNVTTRAFDARGRQILQSDTLGHRSETAYDPFDRPARETRFACVAPCAPPAGIDASRDAVTTTTYYPTGQPRTVTNPNGAVTTFTLDGLNRVTGTLTALPEGDRYTTATTWDGNGNKIQETDRRGVHKQFHYDALNRLESVEILSDSVGGGPFATVNAYGYDAVGNRTSERDVSGQTTRFEYDGLYRVARKVLPEGTPSAGPYTETYAFDRVGNRLSATDANGRTSSWQYDGLNRVVLSRNALGQQTTTVYADPEGSHVNKSEERDLVRGLRSTFAFDALNRETRREVHLDGAGGGGTTYVTSTAYDDAAHAVRVTDPRGTTTLTHLDSLDRPTASVVDEGGLALETRSSYDGLGNRQAVRDPNGNVTEWRSDGLGRQVALTDALGRTAFARYDGEGLKIEATDRRGVVTSSSYDSLGRPRRTLVMPGITGNPWAHETEYDDPGRRRTETDARHHATVLDLDRIGRVVKETDVLGGSAETTWDGVNRRTTKDKNGNVTRYDYDAVNRLTTTTDAKSQTVVTTYDDASNVRLDKDRRGTLTRTQLDPLGRVVRVTRAWDAAQQKGIDAETNTWDGNGNRVRQVDAEGHATQFDYDAANRLVRRTDGAGSTVASTTSYEYDANGNRTLEYDQRHSKEEPTLRSTYDTLNHLVSSRDGEGNLTRHAYDPEGNKASTTEPSGAVTAYAYDERSKLVRVSQPGGLDTVYVYDENRNLIRQTDANGHVVEKTYDSLDRLRSTVQDAATGGLGLVTLHEYDANGNESLLTDPEGPDGDEHVGRAQPPQDARRGPSRRGETTLPLAPHDRRRLQPTTRTATSSRSTRPSRAGRIHPSPSPPRVPTTPSTVSRARPRRCPTAAPRPSATPTTATARGSPSPTPPASSPPTPTTPRTASPRPRRPPAPRQPRPRATPTARTTSCARCRTRTASSPPTRYDKADRLVSPRRTPHDRRPRLGLRLHLRHERQPPHADRDQRRSDRGHQLHLRRPRPSGHGQLPGRRDRFRTAGW